MTSEEADEVERRSKLAKVQREMQRLWDRIESREGDYDYAGDKRMLPSIEKMKAKFKALEVEELKYLRPGRRLLDSDWWRKHEQHHPSAAD